ncbi:MAG: hypothetical protein H7Y13_09275 [Sphingobacteriaceae bacterium]|nr:hypothetical protein [Sphingobacteriaceae bacterium]
MKSFTKLLAGISCLSISFFSCEKESVKIDKENSFNVQFKSTIDESVVLKNDQENILIQVKNINDKRCSGHLDCSDPGVATVRFKLSNRKNAEAESLLFLGAIEGQHKLKDSVNVRLDNSWYTVTLHKVNPHPMADSTEVQTAEMCVKRKL